MLRGDVSLWSKVGYGTIGPVASRFRVWVASAESQLSGTGRARSGGVSVEVISGVSLRCGSGLIGGGVGLLVFFFLFLRASAVAAAGPLVIAMCAEVVDLRLASLEVGALAIRRGIGLRKKGGVWLRRI